MTTADPSSARVPRLAQKIGRYDIVGHLAAGGMAEILLGRITGPSGFERAVVIKRILPHLAMQKDFVDMFLDEARIVAGVRHSNVVQVNELGHEEGELFLVMEYLEGENASGLQRRLRANEQQLEPVLAAYIVAEAAAGLHAAHELKNPDGRLLNVVHRDISPQNVFVTYNGEVKVLDFGIATAADRVARTEAGQFKGKFDYASPEQCLGKAIDRRSDVFALGIVLYELSTGTRLFKRSNELLTMRAIVDGKIMPPTSVVKDFPPELSGIIMRALTRSVESRCPTAQEMRRDLLAYIRQAAPDVDPQEELAKLMQGVFADRHEEKSEMLRRMRTNSTVGEIPAIETDSQVVLPVAFQESEDAESEAATLANAPQDSAEVPILPVRRTPTWLLAAFGLVVGTVLAVSGVLVMRRGRAPEPSSTTTATNTATVLATSAAPTQTAVAWGTAATGTATATAAASTNVVLRVETTPPGAHVWVGGVDHGVSPVDVKLPRGKSPLDIELRRDGFVVVKDKVVPDVDQRMRLNLTPAAPIGQAQTKPTATASANPYRRFD